ncbi:DEAD/DEAH box helicase [Candidatus Dependentiae bacterium]|nr:DEAD/DEAH box helicase [Candidatus Dependentiae bacterium]
MNCFSQISGLSEQILVSLKKMNFSTPTPIQAQSIPLALAGNDILGSAQTGTGKTGAFAIPLVAKILNNEIHSALVLTPTRELAVQVLSQIHAILGKQSNISTALLIGGEPMPKQFQQLRKHPRIIVGTPGRINDHLERETVSFQKTGFLVLDETDRMLDMGFGKQIDSILKHFPGKVQTLMFSATMPKNIMQMAAKYLQKPERIEVGSSLKPIEAVDQQNKYIIESEKYNQLLQEIDERDGSIIVFVKTKFGAKKIADKLYRDGCAAQAIHGNLRQNKRESVLKMFRNNKFRILVATDVAARGLDVPHIQHVINHDLPQCPEDYIHRIGRTARAGAKGFAINFITDGEKRLWKAIERFMSTGDQSTQQRGSTRDNNRRPFKKTFRSKNTDRNFKSEKSQESRPFSYRNNNQQTDRQSSPKQTKRSHFKNRSQKNRSVDSSTSSKA